MYYLLLQQILGILLSKTITHNMITHLEFLIEAHHEAYSKMFEAFEPKTQNMLYYAECPRRFGPLANIWSMRCDQRSTYVSQLRCAITLQSLIRF